MRPCHLCEHCWARLFVPSDPRRTVSPPRCIHSISPDGSDPNHFTIQSAEAQSFLAQLVLQSFQLISRRQFGLRVATFSFFLFASKSATFPCAGSLPLLRCANALRCSSTSRDIPGLPELLPARFASPLRSVESGHSRPRSGHHWQGDYVGNAAMSKSSHRPPTLEPPSRGRGGSCAEAADTDRSLRDTTTGNDGPWLKHDSARLRAPCAANGQDQGLPGSLSGGSVGVSLEPSPQAGAVCARPGSTEMNAAGVYQFMPPHLTWDPFGWVWVASP